MLTTQGASTGSLVNRGKRLARFAATASASHEHTLIQRRIATTDQEIDHLVHELYGLTEEEIAIINPR